MNIRKSALAFIFLPLAFLLATLGPAVAQAGTGDPEGSTTQMPAFFNGQQFTVNMVELPGVAKTPFSRTIRASTRSSHRRT